MSRASLKDEEKLSSNSFLSPESVSQKQTGRKRPTLLKRLSSSSLLTVSTKELNNGDTIQPPEATSNKNISGDEGSKIDSKNKFTHQRKHSNTISGDMSSYSHAIRAPSTPRRSSDGPLLHVTYPTTINISAPTPTTATFSDEVFSTSATGLTFELLQSQGTPSNTDFGDDLGNNKAPTPIASPEHPEEPITSSTPAGRESMDSHRPRGISISTISSTTSLGSSGTDLNRSISLPSHGKIATRRKANSRRTSLETTTSSEGGFSAAGGSVATICGLEIANAKRNAEFHTLFRSVPEDDMLIEDYGCALQKEILVQGRIYISEHHICFNANIFGWVTNLVLAFSEIVSVEKKMTAMIIPNGIQICTLHAKHSFASFLSRDMAYDQMMDVWRVAHPTNPAVQKIAITTESGTAQHETSSDEETDDSDATLSEGDDDDDIEHTRTEASLVDALGIAHPMTSPEKTEKKIEPTEEELARRRAISDVGPRPNGLAANVSVKSPVTLPKTECQCQHSGSHYPNVALDAVFPGSIEALYNLLFNSSFISNFLVEGEKSQDVNIGNWTKDADKKETVRKSTYIKYLGMPIGPKTTKCHLEERCFECDFNKAITVLTTTQTPDVPMGSSFSVKTRACITSTGEGSARLLVTFQIEFTKGGFLKSTIEKASTDGQITYYKNLAIAIRAYITSHPGEFGQGRKKKRDKHSGKVRKVKLAKVCEELPEDVKRKSLVKATESNSKASLYRALEDSISGMATLSANIIRFFIDHVGIPSSAQITLFFFGLLVLSNVFLLKKMSIVDKQLSDLSSSQGMHGISTIDLDQERELLWQYLQQRTQHKTKAQVNIAKQWNKHAMDILRKKALLDQQILGIQSVIRGAEDQLDKLSPVTSKTHH
ncbi:hypothetical protein BC943DRAFT_315496 [Umbelopsis sp. AD052]|nr:hypothetical protein BC943DRAFT_315496 [Umbelopsis sp. AD052]